MLAIETQGVYFQLMALHYLHRHVPFQEKTVFVMNTLENGTSPSRRGPEATPVALDGPWACSAELPPNSGSPAKPDKRKPREAGSPAGVSGERRVEQGRQARRAAMTYDKKNSLVMAAQSWSGI